MVETLPLIYSCSGCSNVAQLANDVALAIDADGSAEMSCIAGVGGGVRSLVRKALSGRKIIALDGCPLNCAKACLARHNIVADYHFELSKMLRIKKTYHKRCDAEDVDQAKKRVYQQIK